MNTIDMVEHRTYVECFEILMNSMHERDSYRRYVDNGPNMLERFYLN
jgi:hypothetical protein